MVLKEPKNKAGLGHRVWCFWMARYVFQYCIQFIQAQFPSEVLIGCPFRLPARIACIILAICSVKASSHFFGNPKKLQHISVNILNLIKIHVHIRIADYMRIILFYAHSFRVNREENLFPTGIHINLFTVFNASDFQIFLDEIVYFITIVRVSTIVQKPLQISDVLIIRKSDAALISSLEIPHKEFIFIWLL